MKVRVAIFRLTLTPTLSHKWERERLAGRLRFIVGSGLRIHSSHLYVQASLAHGVEYPCQMRVYGVTADATSWSWPMNTKDDIRKQVWNLLEEKRVARFPGTQGRIPNFAGAENCARLLSQSPLWKKAKVIKVNPDSPQRAIRQRALEEGKTIYMAVPRLHTIKPFIELNPIKLTTSPFHASSIKGAAKYGRPVSLDEVKKIDLIVCGSVAINRKGARIGKGGGYSDLEYALLREEKKVDHQTPIVTTVHALQVLEIEMPMTEHDIPINVIVTPEEVISLKPPFQKPKGIYWDILPTEKIDAIPVLKARKRKKPGWLR